MVQRAFTPRSQLQSVSLTEPGSNTALSVSAFEYDAGRRETSRTYGNGITTTRTYRADNLVTTITAPAVESLAYTYDINKNPTSELRSGVMAPYSWATGESGFDAQNRLTNWTRQNGDSQSWQLTAVNDWQSFTNNGVQQQRTHGPTHEIQSIDNTPLIHDSRGNLTQDNRGTSMTYDADNMLSVFGANSVEGLRNATYTYDALGRRVSKTVAGATANDPATTTLFILANQQVIAEYSSIGTTQPTLASRTAYGTYIDEPLILLSNLQSQIAYYHTNRQYSVYTLTDATGSILDRIAYTPYGEHYCLTPVGAPRSHISEAGNKTHFTGRTADAESGLHYFRARYFAPKLGRFLSHDPILYPDGWNTYPGWFVPKNLDPNGNDLIGDVLGIIPSYQDLINKLYYLETFIHGVSCKTIEGEIRNKLNTEDEKLAWDHFTGGNGSPRTLTHEQTCAALGGPDVAGELNRRLYGEYGYRAMCAQTCRSKISDRKTRVHSWGQRAKPPFVGSLGGVRVRFVWTCNCCPTSVAYCAEIDDLYDFDPRGIPGFTDRTSSAEAKTIAVWLAQVMARCGWKEYQTSGSCCGNTDK